MHAGNPCVVSTRKSIGVCASEVLLGGTSGLDLVKLANKKKAVRACVRACVRA